MLSRTTQVGEFYVMRAPPFCPKKGAKGFMDMFIYDEEGDRHVRIGWEAALKASGIDSIAKNATTGALEFGEAAELPEFDGTAYKTLTTESLYGVTAGTENNAAAGKLSAWYGHAMWLAHYNNKGVPEDDTAYSAFSTKYNAVALNIFLVVCRPFIEHVMHSAIAMVGGRDTGATLFGPAGARECLAFPQAAPDSPPSAPALADMQISANTQVKTIEVSGAAALTDGSPSTHLPRARTRRHPDCRAGPLHRPLQVGRDQAAERVRHARHRLRRVRRGRQLRVV